jgi:ribosome-associated protein
MRPRPARTATVVPESGARPPDAGRIRWRTRRRFSGDFCGRTCNRGCLGHPPEFVGARLITEGEVVWTAIRAQGAGGQNVNKVSSAIHLRFDIPASALSDAVKSRLLACGDQRITPGGVVVIKAQRYRTQERNLADAMARLQELVDTAARVPRARKPTRPSKGSQRRRVESKVKRGQIKAARSKVVE